MDDPPKRLKKQFDGSLQQSPLDDFVLFLDENLHKCAPVIAALDRMDTRYVRHIDCFVAGELDEKWLPKVSQEGWIILTKDKGIRYNELEIAAIKQNKGREFVFGSGNWSGEQMADILSKALPKMKRLAKRTEAPFIASLTQTGAVHLRYDKNGSIYEQKRNAKKEHLELKGSDQLGKEDID